MADKSSENQTGPRPSDEEKGEEKKILQNRRQTQPRQKNLALKTPSGWPLEKQSLKKTCQAHEAERKAAAEAAVIIANKKAEKAKKREATRQEITPPEDDDGQQSSFSASQHGFSTTQWFMVGSITISLIGIYYKREEIKSALKTSAYGRDTNKKVQESQSEENVSAPPNKKGLRKME